MPEYGIVVKGLPSSYEAEHLARVFYPGARLRQGACTRGPLIYARAGARRLAVGLRGVKGGCHMMMVPAHSDAKARKQALSRLLYDLLCQATGLRPPWGLLTGVRPVNLLRKRLALLGEQGAEEYFKGYCDVSGEKYAMARGIVERQRPVLQASGPLSYSLYISIPFCPSRCAYCSFVSQSVEREGHLMDPYLDALCLELEDTARLARRHALRLAAIYIGGGTPTALNHRQLDRLLCMVEQYFDTGAVAEYTVEAGRPDCTDAEKLAILRRHGVGRVSINPQSLSDSVLKAIGRRHSAADVLRCYSDARAVGFDAVNMDLIAGLPRDDEAGFADTLEKVVALAPENITLHSLTLKRASNLVTQGVGGASSPSAMLAGAYPRLKQAGYAPYYLYRQKSGVENLENTGWCKPGKAGLYNVYIMEDAHTILAVGAGASTKLVAGAAGQKLRRIYNQKLPREYLAHFEESQKLKQEGVNAFYAGNLDTQAPG